LMPWLAGTALLHSAVVMEKRNALKVWTILLSILTFSLSLLGTFLVRSGVLTSVHAFATDPTRGVFILLILCIFIGGSLSLYAFRASTLKQGGLFAPISREGALVLNNLFLTTACARGGATLAPLAIGLAVFVIAGALSDLAERTGLFRIPLTISFRRARGLPRSTWGTAFAHAGVGVALIGIVCETTWNSEYIAT